MNSRAWGKACTSSKMTRDLRSLSSAPNSADRYRKKLPMSERVSRNVCLKSSVTFVKSISRYVSYSALANFSTTVDFPTRRAPSTRSAVDPLLVDFQASSSS